jgi:hypothetical protein
MQPISRVTRACAALLLVVGVFLFGLGCVLRAKQNSIPFIFLHASDGVVVKVYGGVLNVIHVRSDPRLAVLLTHDDSLDSTSSSFRAGYMQGRVGEIEVPLTAGGINSSYLWRVTPSDSWYGVIHLARQANPPVKGVAGPRITKTFIADWALISAGAALLAARIAWFAYGRYRRARRPRHLCPNCDYDLRGSTSGDRCPECGQAIDERTREALIRMA